LLFSMNRICVVCVSFSDERELEYQSFYCKLRNEMIAACVCSYFKESHY